MGVHILGEPTIEQKLDAIMRSSARMALIINNLNQKVDNMNHQLNLLTEVAKGEESYNYWETRLQELNNLQAKYFANKRGDAELFDEARKASSELHKIANTEGGDRLRGYNDGVVEYGEWKIEEDTELVEMEPESIITPQQYGGTKEGL